MPTVAKCASAQREERGAGPRLFVVEDLRVCVAAVVVDHRVDVVEPDPPFAVPGSRAGCATVSSPPATVGDPADLLDVHVDQLAGPVAFVTDRGRLRPRGSPPR